MKVPHLATQVHSSPDIPIYFQTLSLHARVSSGPDIPMLPARVSSDPDVPMYSQIPSLPPRGSSGPSFFEPFHPLSKEIRLRAKARHLVNCITHGTSTVNPLFQSLIDDNVFCFSRNLLDQSRKGAGLYDQIKDLDPHELALMVALLCANPKLVQDTDIAGALRLLISTINIREEQLGYIPDGAPLELSKRSRLVIEQVLQLVNYTTVPIVFLFYYEHAPPWLEELLNILRNAAQFQTLCQATVIETGLRQSIQQKPKGYDRQYNPAWLEELLDISTKVYQSRTSTPHQVDTTKIDIWQLFYAAPMTVENTLAPRMWHMLSLICWLQISTR